MDWNSDITRSRLVLELLSMGEIDPDLMMDALFKTLTENGKEILAGNDRPGSEISEAMDTVIKWFSDNERYEECTQLKKIKEECLKLK